jgi:signal transduction histidine kinase
LLTLDRMPRDTSLVGATMLSVVQAIRNWCLAAAVAAGLVLAMIGQFIDPQAAPLTSISFNAFLAISFTAMAALVLRSKPRHRVGLLMAAAGASSCLAVLSASWSGWLPLAWISQWSWLLPFGLIFVALLLFPDGRLPSRRWLPLAGLVIAAVTVAVVALAIAAVDHPRNLVTTVERQLTDRASAWLRIAFGAGLVAVGCLIGVLAALTIKWRRASGETRLQIACLIPATVILLGALLIEGGPQDGPWVQVIATAAIPVAMTVAILRYRLYELDRIINRTIVWLVMTVLVFAAVVAISALLSDALTGVGLGTTLALTGLILALAAPIRRWAQRFVDRLLYGDTSEPYRVLERLGGVLLGPQSGSEDLLTRLAKELAESMRVPYVAVKLDGFDTPVSASHGGAVPTVESIPMVAYGTQIGTLEVATRTLGGHFTGRERRLLANGALLAAVAGRAMQLVYKLEESRAQLVLAEQVERQRLWRELHDGTSQMLSALRMKIWMGQEHVADPRRMAQLLRDLEGCARDCHSEVYEIVEHLRPAALERGLVFALENLCMQATSENLTVNLAVNGEVDDIPHTTQLAAHRIISEAVRNVLRHSEAALCHVEIRRHGQKLAASIADNGVGLVVPLRRSSGLDIMRERAEELGGELTVTPNQPRGTIVSLQLPLVTTPPRRVNQPDSLSVVNPDEEPGS